MREKTKNIWEGLGYVTPKAKRVPMFGYPKLGKPSKKSKFWQIPPPRGMLTPKTKKNLFEIMTESDYFQCFSYGFGK